MTAADTVSRREFLKSALAASAVLALPGAISGCSPAHTALRATPSPWLEWPLERRIAQMLMVGFPGKILAPDSPIDRDIHHYGVCGVVLFDNDAALQVEDRNIIGPDQLKALSASLQARAATPLFIAVDQEGGKVARLKELYGFAPTVSARYLGEKDNLKLTGQCADSIAATLSRYGMNLNLAPVVDVNLNPDNPVISLKERSFSADPAAVAAHAGEMIRHFHDWNIVTCLKHFPGHGSSRDDSHLGLVDVSGVWSERELLPYQLLISQGLCDMVMTAHTFNARLDREYPATLSRTTIDGILRKRLGFNGVVASDDLNMGAIVRNYSYETAVEKALNAGVDLLIIANDKIYDQDVTPKSIELISRMVKRGQIAEERVNEACGRIMLLKSRYLSASAS